MTKEKNECIEFEMGKHTRKFYILVYPFSNPPEIWIDTKFLPGTGKLCALIDNTPMFFLKVGKKHNLERMFVNIEWVINEWGGPDKFVDACKKRRDNFLGRMEEFRMHLNNKKKGGELILEAGDINK